MQKFPNYFADAETDFRNAKYIMFGVPYDKTAYFRKGTKEAPNAIRQASWGFEAFDIKTSTELNEIPVHDFGNIQTTNKDKPEMMIRKVQKMTEKILEKNRIPIGIGGEHSITPGIIKAFKNKKENIGVISLDAHLDFRNKFEKSKYSHACVTKRLSEIIGVENIAVLGVRTASKKEMQQANEMNLFYTDCFTILEGNIKKIIKQVLQKMKNKKIYLSIDFDVIDPTYAPAVSTPEPFGLSQWDLLECISILSKNLVGFDLVEVNPKYDQGQTAILAASFIRRIIFENWKTFQL